MLRSKNCVTLDLGVRGNLTAFHIDDQECKRNGVTIPVSDSGSRTLVGRVAVMSVEKSTSSESAISIINFPFTRVITATLLGFGLCAMTELGYGRKAPDAGAQGATPGEQSSTAVRAFPRVALWAGRQLEYVGAFSADGKFKPLNRFGLFIDSMKTASASGQSVPPDATKLSEEDVMKQVPPNIELHRNERLMEDFQPPEHAVKIAKGHSVIEELRDSFVSLAYGPDQVLMAPQSVTTDSLHRVIVTDAAAHGLHILAYTPKNSFQIVGGTGRRLQSPSGVAVDKDDNIYVSDSERGMVFVYDSQGSFSRTIGSFDGEGLFEHPTGIAIDCKAGRLYVLDPPRHILFILDLDGHVLARVGTIDGTGAGFSRRAGSSEPGKFNDPQAVSVHNDELIVLDGTRVHILNLQGRFLKEFRILSSGVLPAGPTPGLFMDNENHIYVGDPGSGTIRVYNHDGLLLRVLGRPGPRMGEFNAPAGMWADSTGRVYIVDAHRIQIFQFSGTK